MCAICASARLRLVRSSITRQQVLRLALLVADRHPRRGDDAVAAARRRGRMLVVELRLAGAAAARRSCSAISSAVSGGKTSSDGLADHALARHAEICFAGAVDQHVAQRLGVLHDDRRRHVLDHGGGEGLAAVALLLGAAALGDVLVRHHPAAAVGRRLADDRR